MIGSMTFQFDHLVLAVDLELTILVVVLISEDTMVFSELAVFLLQLAIVRFQVLVPTLRHVNVITYYGCFFNNSKKHKLITK